MIFIVDDDDATRDSLRLLVECDGFAAQDFASGRAFLDAVRPTDSDCLIVDVNMPGMTGFQVLEELHRRGARPSVIVVTGGQDPAARKRAMAAGALALLDKPLATDQLLALLRRAVGHEEG